MYIRTTKRSGFHSSGHELFLKIFLKSFSKKNVAPGGIALLPNCWDDANAVTAKVHGRRIIFTTTFGTIPETLCHRTGCDRTTGSAACATRKCVRPGQICRGSSACGHVVTCRRSIRSSSDGLSVCCRPCRRPACPTGRRPRRLRRLRRPPSSPPRWTAVEPSARASFPRAAAGRTTRNGELAFGRRRRWRPRTRLHAAWRCL